MSEHEVTSGCRTECPDTFSVPLVASESPQTSPLVMDSEKLKLVGSLAGSLAHDFNNPLCGIRSVLERFARKSELPEAEKHLLQMALQQCERMKIQLQDVQDFIYASPHKLSRFDLRAVIAVVLRLMHKQLKLSQVVVYPACEQEPVMLEGNEDQVKQMLLYILAASCRGLAGSQCEVSLQLLREGNVLRLLWRFQVEEGAVKRLEQLFADLAQPNPILDSGLVLAHAILESHGGTMLQNGAAQGGGVLEFSLPVEQHSQ
ncbi:MAG: histidine kinase dimerization/phospho-acceptor domain-containing protein [Desulfobulbus sp.]